MNHEMRADYLQSNTNGSQLQATASQGILQKNGLSSSAANGHSPPASATPIYSNGFSSSAREPRPQTFYGHDREEVTRLLIQGLGDLGYESSAHRLSQESGYEVESPTVAAFRHAVLHGDWADAESLLFGPETSLDGGGVSIRGGGMRGIQRLDFVDGVDKDYLKFVIREQKYLEYLEKQDTGRALMVLQTELQPLKPAVWDKSRLNGLSE